ncbi:MAG: MFS transporter [Chloroflexi bacterium]|nr:MFS transporter [Chloroflexota bacterium]
MTIGGVPPPIAPPADTPGERSYRALLGVPSLGRVLLAMQIARIAGSMLGVATVLFTLAAYHSTILAGVVTFASVVPGLLVSPIAGALLDRHGRGRLVVIDYVAAMGSLVLIGALALANALPAALLVLIAAVSSLTGPLSATGVRSLFPIIVPRHLWERMNAVDSAGFVVASIVGPPVAAGLVATLGGPRALIVIGLAFGIAAVVMIGIREPESVVATTGSLLRDAWLGLRYTLGNPTLRGLGAAISTLNLAGGMTTIMVPVIVLQRLGLGELVVGAVFAIEGLGGVVAASLMGRIDTRGRERLLIGLPMFAFAAAFGVLLLPGGLWTVIVALLVIGVANGPIDVAMFTLRQRRTDPAWTGRAFAVSMSINYLGSPIGSVLAGWLVAASFEGTVGVAVAASLLAAVFALRLIPGAAVPISEVEAGGGRAMR